MDPVKISLSAGEIPSEGEVVLSAAELKKFMEESRTHSGKASELVSVREELEKVKKKYDQSLDTVNQALTFVDPRATEDQYVDALKHMMQLKGYSQEQIDGHVASLRGSGSEPSGGQGEDNGGDDVSNAEVEALKAEIQALKDGQTNSDRQNQQRAAADMNRRMGEAIESVVRGENFAGGLAKQSMERYAEDADKQQEVLGTFSAQIRQETLGLIREAVNKGESPATIRVEDFVQKASDAVGNRYQTVIGEQGLGPTPETVAGTGFAEELAELSKVKAPTDQEVRDATHDDMNALHSRLEDSNTAILMQAAQEAEGQSGGDI